MASDDKSVRLSASEKSVRLSADIGGTFTDVVLSVGEPGSAEERYSTKVLTTHQAPADAVLEGVGQVLDQAGREPNEIDLVVHGTTLGTNTLIERRGATTALITTEGFRDSVAMAHENRFEQYDLAMERPEPLVPRHRRLGVPERLAATGEVLVPLDADTVRGLVPQLVADGVESVAIGFLHSYVDPSHERQARDVLAAAWPGDRPPLSITLSSEVCPEIREYERLSTACANAYIQPLMASYLTDLDQRLEKLGIQAPLLLMLSNGGLCTLATAVQAPVGLVESGPAGGALLAARVAAEHQLNDLLSFDMGGTTAKLCLLAADPTAEGPEGNGTGAVPATSREFEVARVYRFLKGSGLPLRIPVIDLVEIGAGGGSIATVDRLGRTTVGPESAGSEPGPACYGRGGDRPTVTDADALAGRLDSAWFAGGTMALDVDAARDAVAGQVAAPLAVELDTAVVGIGEMVAEQMANAARVHAVERGRDLGGGAMVAFGGAAPLHACRLADRLSIDTVIVPPGAGVGSAIGFLVAPVSYELVRTCHQRLDDFDVAAVNQVIDELRAEARQVVAEAAGDPEPLVETLHASMRYRGQGHEIDVPLPAQSLGDDAVALLTDRFDRTYRSLYRRVIPGMVAEALTWRVRVSTMVDPPEEVAAPPPHPYPVGASHRILDAAAGWVTAALVDRAALEPGHQVPGPALIVESQTTTVVSPSFDATVDGRHHLVLRRRSDGNQIDTEQGGR